MRCGTEIARCRQFVGKDVKVLHPPTVSGIDGKMVTMPTEAGRSIVRVMQILRISVCADSRIIQDFRLHVRIFGKRGFKRVTGRQEETVDGDAFDTYAKRMRISNRFTVRIVVLEGQEANFCSNVNTKMSFLVITSML